MKPLVSVTVCCYNSAKYLEETLRSVCSQTFKNWELVIVNDGSTDSTEEIIRGFIQEGWPIVYHAQSNIGLGKTRQKTIEMANGEYVAILDHDDLWYPEKLQRQMEVFREHSNAVVVYSGCDVIDSDGKISQRNVQQWQGGYTTGRVFEALLTKQFFPCWPTVVIKKSVLEEIGGFAHYQYGEDLDLLLKVARKGDFECVQQILAAYRVHGSQLGRRYDAWLHDWIDINRYWSRDAEFRSAEGQRFLAHLRGLDYRRVGLNGFNTSDETYRVRLYLWKSLGHAFSLYVLMLWFLSWFGLARARLIVRFAKTCRSYWKWRVRQWFGQRPDAGTL